MTDDGHIYTHIEKYEKRAAGVFQDPNTAHEWLRRPNKALSVSPIELHDSEDGYIMGKRVLTHVQDGEFS